MADAPTSLSVGALNAYVGALLAGDEKLRDLCVLGEISNFKRHSSGHLYFSLKDASAVVRCVMFRSFARNVQLDIDNGLNVCARGYVSIYERDGQYQLYVQGLEPQGLGALYEKFETLKARLQAEGLFDPAVKKPVPRYVRTVGVVTSPTGAAVRDIIHVLTRRNDSVRIVISPANVQGAGAAVQIASAISLLNRVGDVDVIIVGRGGGSIEELWAFNEEAVARSIYESSVPVISAVGHETDFTIADFVADLRAPTPSAAAELAVERKADQIAALMKVEDAVQRSIQKMIDKGLSDLEHFRGRLDRMHLAARIDVFKDLVEDRQNRLTARIQALLAQRGEYVGSITMRLHALSPMDVLSRGYTFTRDEATGRIVTGAAGLRAGQRLTIVYRDGHAGVTVDNAHADGKAES